MNCLLCDKELEEAIKGEDHQPFRGTTFISYGQYGSTVYDPISSYEYLQINICDSCMLENKAKILHVHKVPRPAKYEYETWNPEV